MEILLRFRELKLQICNLSKHIFDKIKKYVNNFMGGLIRMKIVKVEGNKIYKVTKAVSMLLIVSLLLSVSFPVFAEKSGRFEQERTRLQLLKEIINKAGTVAQESKVLIQLKQECEELYPKVENRIKILLTQKEKLSSEQLNVLKVVLATIKEKRKELIDLNKKLVENFTNLRKYTKKSELLKINETLNRIVQIQKKEIDTLSALKASIGKILNVEILK